MIRAHCCLAFPIMLFLLAVSIPLQGATLIIEASAAGGDAADGSPDKPFGTISAAANRAQPGDRVLIRPGIYREDVQISVSGTPENPIVFEAEKPNTVFISAADPVTDWTRVEGEQPIYWATWTRDYFTSGRDEQGNRLRWVKQQGRVSQMEIVIWDGRALRTAREKTDMAPGTFHVDWDQDRLYVWLPSGGDPNQTEVLSGARQGIFGPKVVQQDWSLGKYITVRNLTFQHAANSSGNFPSSAVNTNDGWVVEDCTVEWCNAMGINVRGRGVQVYRTIAQHNGHSGFVGSGRDILIKDSVNRYNNWKEFSPTGSGSNKFTRMRNLTLDGFQSYNNIGKGIWLDIDNHDCKIINCVVYGNRGLRQAFEAAGIFVEISEGPVLIANNIVYSNTGGGIRVAESTNVVVENNILVDNGEAIEFRAMPERHVFGNVVVRNNVFKDWRRTGVSTTLGEWDNNSPATRNIVMEGNVYDPPADKPLFTWANKDYTSLKEVQETLKLERGASIKQVTFDRPLVESRVVRSAGMPSFRKILAERSADGVVVLPANGRTSIEKADNGWTCSVYDLQNGIVRLTIDEARLRDAVARIQQWPETVPVNVKVRITSDGPTGTEATLLAVE